MQLPTPTYYAGNSSDPDAICLLLSARMYGSVSPNAVCYSGLYVNAAIFPPFLLRCPLLSATTSIDWLDSGLKAHPKDICCTHFAF